MCARILIVTADKGVQDICQRALAGVAETVVVNSLLAATYAVEAQNISSILLDPFLPDALPGSVITHINTTFYGWPVAILAHDQVSDATLLDAAWRRGMDSKVWLSHDKNVAMEHVRQSVENSLNRAKWPGRWRPDLKGVTNAKP